MAAVQKSELRYSGMTMYMDLVSIAYPPSAQEDRTPLQVPIAMGSAVW